MKYAVRASTLILAGFLAMASTCVRAGGQGGGTVDPAAMAQADTVDTRRGDLLQGTPQGNRWDTRLGTLSLMSLDIAINEPARRP